MLDGIFMQILDMSKTACIVILVVILARLLLKKAPKVFSYALWAVVLFRLLCPVTFEAPVSIVPEMTSVSQDYTLSEEPISVLGASEAAYQAVGDALNGGLGIQHIPTTEKDEIGMTKYVTTDWWSVWILFGQYVWVTGMAVMLLYSIAAYLKVRKKLSVVVPLRDNIFIADDIKSPFVVGLFRPKIYLPCNLGEKEQEYIILHEQHHIRRFDHIIKALAFLALAIHWFNPLVWAAFILAGKDMEMSCDEAVIRKVGGDVRADYSASLLTLATGRRIIAGTPLAFGEGDTKGRIHNLSKWKKPAVWIVLVAVIVCIVLALCLLTNPVAQVEIGNVESVTVDNISVSEKAADELVSLINSHRRTHFVVGLDDPNSLSRAIVLDCSNGDSYLLHYQYYSGFSFDPRHAGEDAYRSILTFFKAGEGGQKAWKMEYDFDAKLRDWLSEYSSPSFGAFSINQPYGVVEVTYENGMTSFSMVAQVNTPEYRINENKHLLSVKEHSATPNWTDLGELSEITLTEESFDALFQNNRGAGWFGRESASEIRKNTVQAWSVLYNQEKLYYILQQRNGELYLAYGYYDYSEKDDPGSDDTYIRWLYKIAPQSSPASSPVTKWFDYFEAPDEMKWDDSLEINLPEFPDVAFRWSYGEMEAVTGNKIISLYTGMPIWNAYFCDLTGDGLPELCSTISWGSGMIDNRVIIYDYASGASYSLEARGVFDYTLRQGEDGGQLYVDKNAHMGGGFLSTGQLVFKDGTIQILGQDLPTDTILEIIDPTDDPNFSYDTAVEKIYEDENNEYLLSGLYSQYVIVHYADGTQEDIVTALNSGRAAVADLDRFGIRYWAEPKGDPLDTAISEAILDHYASDKPDGLIHVECHVLLANEAMSGTPLFGADNHVEKVTAYLLVHHVKYSTYGGKLEAVGGSYVPTAITFKIGGSGEYILEEYWEPRDGSYYVKDIRGKFPGSSAADALNDQAYIEDLKAQAYNKALTYLSSIGSVDDRIAVLLEAIQSSPAYSSNPGDYIRAHETEYEELLSYGEYTLRYCFTEFLQGGQTDLCGHIMALGCQDIMLAWGEGYAIDQNLFTGQDWFDEFRGNAESLSGQFSHEELEKHFPGAFLLLQMNNREFVTKDALN